MKASVTLYGTSWCGVARDLRLFLQSRGVPYDFRNVETDAHDEAAAMTMNEGKYQVPVVVIGARVLRNPVHGVLERELVRQGLIATGGSGAAESAAR